MARNGNGRRPGSQDQGGDEEHGHTHRLFSPPGRECPHGGRELIQNRIPRQTKIRLGKFLQREQRKRPRHLQRKRLRIGMIPMPCWRRRAYWTFAVSELAAFRVKVQLRVLAPALLHTPDQITDRAVVALRVMLVPTGKLAEPVVPTGTFTLAGVETTLTPARPVAVTVSVAVVGAAPQTFATPAPPQVCGVVQAPQVSVPPQPSEIAPQFFPCAAQVVGVQAGGLVTTPCHRVRCCTPPTVQLTWKLTALPAGTVPAARKWTAVARTSDAAWAANGVTVAVPEMAPTLTVTPVQPAG